MEPIKNTQETKEEHLQETLVSSETGLENERRLEDLNLRVDLVKECAEGSEEFVGRRITFIAMKNHNSYLIASDRAGLILLEDGAKLCSDVLPRTYKYLSHTIYYPPEDCYFLTSRTNIYKKDIDGKAPYLFIDAKVGYGHAAFLRNSILSKRLMFCMGGRHICVINPIFKRIEVQMKSDLGNDFISDFRVFGKKEDRVVSVTWKGHIFLYAFGSTAGRGIVGHHQEELIEEDRKEAIQSVAVCEKNEYLFVETGHRISQHCSRMIILRVNQNTLVKTATIDQFDQQIGFKFALEPLGRFGSHLLWVGLTLFKSGLIQVFDYNTETEEFRELEEKRVNHRAKRPYKLHLLDEKFYYIDWNAKLRSLTVNL